MGYEGLAVQGEIPMTAQGESAVASPCKRPKGLRPLPPADLILVKNTSAEGSLTLGRAMAGGER